MTPLDYTAIFKGLTAANLPYLVTGGVALNLHGVPRLSFDLDLIPGDDGVEGIVMLLGKWGYRTGQEAVELCSDEGRRRLAEKGVGAVRFTSVAHTVEEIDLAATTLAPFTELAARAVIVHIFGEPVPVIGLRDLAAIKERMGRRQDLDDLQGMEFLAALRDGRDLPGFPEVRREQMLKFWQWPAENRIDWLLTNSQLQRQLDEGGRGGKGRGGLKRRRIKGLRHTDLS